MQDTTDLLQIKIDNAKKQLSKETLDAIASVPWQAEILKMRETKGYTFEQLGDLEIETELALCGLVSSESYPKELENRMRLSKIQVNELLNEMNKQVFSKIKEELIKSTERIPPPLLDKEGAGGGNSKDHHPAFGTPPQKGGEALPDTKEEKKNNTQILKSAGIEIIPEKLELSPPLLYKEGVGGGNSKENHPAFGTPPYQGGEGAPAILTQKLSGYVKNEVVKTEHSLNNLTSSAISTKPAVDPYREIPE